MNGTIPNLTGGPVAVRAAPGTRASVTYGSDSGH